MKTLINPITGIEILEGKEYWYPTVHYCCHFSETGVKSFVFDSSNSGHIEFVKYEPVYETREEAIDKANAILDLFGFPHIS